MYLFAFTEEEAREQIRKSQQLLIQIDNNLKLRPYIPYDIYSDALVELLDARKYFRDKNFVTAYYKASMARVKFETLPFLAEAREIRDRIVIMERDQYKKQSKTVKKDVLLSFEKKGNNYRKVMLDRNLFRGGAYTITKVGKDDLNEVISVLKADSGISAVIAGHTSFRDTKGVSAYKAGIVSQYLQKNGIDPSRIKVYGVGNTEVMDTPWGYKKIDRIEIILQGIRTASE